jgi:hypothetical protein
MDETVDVMINKLSLPNITVIPLNEFESPELLRVKDGRTRGEYCWTVTPFAPEVVFRKDATVKRVTYIDADLFFFDSPSILLKEFSESGKHVLITEHSFDPKYDMSETSGRFCVQFICFNNSQAGMNVLHWWQDRCIEWCFNRIEDGKLGDQKYLDCWPELFPDSIHILQQVDKTLAPWNVYFFENLHHGILKPVFYHFEQLRIMSKNSVFLTSYKIGKSGFHLYEQYIKCLHQIIQLLKANNITIYYNPRKNERWGFLGYIVRRLLGRTRVMKVNF